MENEGDGACVELLRGYISVLRKKCWILALQEAVLESNLPRDVTSCFPASQPMSVDHFFWHPVLMIPGAGEEQPCALQELEFQHRIEKFIFS